MGAMPSLIVPSRISVLNYKLASNLGASVVLTPL